MSIANQPAFPIPATDKQDSSPGMTIKQYYVIYAPQEIPFWFKHVAPKKDLPPLPDWQSIKDEGHKKLCHQWLCDGIFDLPEELQWFSDQYKKHNDASEKWDEENHITRYFQWRIFYADNLIAELEKPKAP